MCLNRATSAAASVLKSSPPLLSATMLWIIVLCLLQVSAGAPLTPPEELQKIVGDYEETRLELEKRDGYQLSDMLADFAAVVIVDVIKKIAEDLKASDIEVPEPTNSAIRPMAVAGNQPTSPAIRPIMAVASNH